MKRFFIRLKKFVFFGKELSVFEQGVNFRDGRDRYREVVGKRQRGGRGFTAEHALIFAFVRFRLYDFGDIVGGNGRKLEVEKVFAVLAAEAVALDICAVQCLCEQLVDRLLAAYGQVEGERFFLAFAEGHNHFFSAPCGKEEKCDKRDGGGNAKGDNQRGQGVFCIKSYCGKTYCEGANGDKNHVGDKGKAKSFHIFGY